MNIVINLVEYYILLLDFQNINTLGYKAFPDHFVYKMQNLKQYV
jgi:hypothetical protein